MNILVTGGAGFVGSHTCKALSRRGFLPIAYDNLSRGHREVVKWGPLEVGDIADSARLHTVLNKYHPMAVMHFAAYAYVGESVEQPILYYHNNFTGTAKSVADNHRLQDRYPSCFLPPALPTVFPIKCRFWKIIRRIRSTLMVVPSSLVEGMLADFRAAYQLHLGFAPVF